MTISLILHDIRSCHNVGSILRTADGFCAAHVYMTGYTPYPELSNDSRLPHLRRKISSQINKTALGAEKTINWSFEPDIRELIKYLRSQRIQIIALEQHESSVALTDFQPQAELAILVGREVEGIEESLLDLVDQIVEIPMHGKKESFNVSIATAIALYHCSSSSQ